MESVWIMYRIILICTYVVDGKSFRTSAHDNTRGNTCLPMVSEVLASGRQGLPTIRAYAAQQRFRSDFLAEMDLNGSWSYAFIGTARWIGFRLDLISAAILMIASILVMALHNKVLVHSNGTCDL